MQTDARTFAREQEEFDWTWEIYGTFYTVALKLLNFIHVVNILCNVCQAKTSQLTPVPPVLNHM